MTESYIIEKISEYKSNSINLCKKISTGNMINILNNKYLSGSEMKKVQCEVERILNSAKYKKNINFLSSKTVKWLKNTTTIASGNNGIIINGVMQNGVEIIIKKPIDISKTLEILTEYYISTIINTLRFLVPNFTYLLGEFKLSKHIYLIYEKVESEKTFSSLLKNVSYTFDDFLLIFCQLLVALEIAQRNCEFTHNDLHPNNLMIKTTQNIKYDVPIDNKTYKFKNINSLAIIIDFGHSRVTNNNTIIHPIGEEYIYYIEYGMTPFFVPGYDMYKFLLFSIEYAHVNIKNKIKKLFNFYGPNDIYNIIKTNNTNIAYIEYCKRVTYSKTAQYNPLMFLKWILLKYKKNLSSNLDITYRLIYLPLYINPLEIYKFECFNKISFSYILSMYTLDIFTKGELQTTKIQNYININREKTIELDNIYLQKYKNIIIPEYNRDVLNIILVLQDYNISLNTPYTHTFKKLHDNIKICKKKIRKYEMLYYIILQLNLNNIYESFIQDFGSSSQYRFLYSDDVSKIEKWCTTCSSVQLMESY